MLQKIITNKASSYRISIIVWGAWPDKKKRWGLWNESINKSLEYFTYGVNFKYPYLSSLWVGIRVLMKKSELTIIHTPWAAIPFCFLNNIIPKKKKCIILEMILDKKWKQMWPLLEKVFKNVDRFIVFSRDEVDYYSKNFNIDKKKLTWLPLGFSLPTVKRDRSTGFNDYVFAGGKTRRDYKLFVHAAKDANIRALIVCGERYFKLLKDKRGEKIEIYPQVDYDTFWRMVSEAKYVVVPLTEKKISCGQLVFLGAMALGKAVVVPKVAATVDYIKDGITGFFYECGEYRSLRCVLERLEKQPEFVKKVGLQAKKEVIKNHNTKDFVKKIEELLFSVLSDNHRS